MVGVETWVGMCDTFETMPGDREPQNDEVRLFVERILNTPDPQVHSEQADRVIRLAQKRPRDALLLARQLTVPALRAKALAVVARRVEQHQVCDIAAEAIAAAQQAPDSYSKTVALAWPIAALAERGELAAASDALTLARQIARTGDRNSSRVSALAALLHGAWHLGTIVRRSLVEEIAEFQRVDSYFRISQALVDSLAMIRESDREFADRLIASMKDEKWVRAAKAAGPCEPRDFFGC